MKNIFFIVYFFSSPFLVIKAEAISKDTLTDNYNSCLRELQFMLESGYTSSFKKAVFLIENVYWKNQLNYESYDNAIRKLTFLAEHWLQSNKLHKYPYSDSLNVNQNHTIYSVLKDSIAVEIDSSIRYTHLPYNYDFNDFAGQDNWANMFVSKLLATHKGNCHSLPYLYKILADELGATCWLALAPNHMYIKNRCKKIGWYNTELTSGDFPIDAWIMASGYLPVKAVQSGIYMDTLSNQQSIALCVLDLAKGYEHQTKNYYDGFIIKCCDLSLQYFPLNIQVMLLKAETLKRVYEKQHADKDKAAKSTYKEMENLYAKIFDFGYREMPAKMYQQWLQSVMKEKEKYSNPKMKQVMQTAKGK